MKQRKSWNRSRHTGRAPQEEFVPPMLAVSLTQETASFPHKLWREERFGKYSLMLAQGSHFVENVRPTRRVNHGNAWVAPVHQSGDSKSIPRSRHMDVGDKQTKGDGWPTFDKRCRFVAIFGLKDFKPRLDKLLGEHVTDQRFIFDDEDAQGASSFDPVLD
jgi:hypothetical protein